MSTPGCTIREESLRFLKNIQLSHLATAGEFPAVRIMAAAQVDEDFSVWYSSFQNSLKHRHIENNPSVCILASKGAEEIRIFGKAAVITDLSLKKTLWKEEWKKHFSGPDDLQYILIKICAVSVEYRNYKKYGETIHSFEMIP